VSGATDCEIEQFMALAALGSELSELLGSLPTITRCQLERLYHLVNSRGWVDRSIIPELGRVHCVANPAALIEAVDTVVWWNFSEPSAPQRVPWTKAELKQLVAHGAQFPSAETVAIRENALWLRPLFAARKKLILVWPRQRAGESIARHPSPPSPYPARPTLESFCLEIPAAPPSPPPRPSWWWPPRTCPGRFAGSRGFGFE
jgi:hypothetical protein